MSISSDKQELKDLIKESVTEAFAQNRDLFVHIIEEVVEDKLFMDAMMEGEETELVSRESVFQVLEGEG